LLVGGSTGAGKSVFLYTLLCAIIKTHPKADDCQILLASSKGEDFVFFEGLPHLVAGRVITDAAEMIEMFRTNVLEETMRRSNILKAAKKRDLTSYNEKAEEKLAPFVVVVDEFADLTDQLTTNADKNAFYTLFKTIAQAGRSRGVHLVLCTQRPSADVVPTNITANLNARLALRVNNAIASRMIIDGKGAESLLKHGDMLYKVDSGSERIRAQGYYIDTDEVEEIVNEVMGINGLSV
jgi:DNA segregation ATPase FtsK/SpoIIIE-like protein